MPFLEFMEANNLHLRPNFQMISDWEIAERNAFQQCFNLPLLGCLFHLGRNRLKMKFPTYLTYFSNP